jgi:hypothetical protein
MRPKLQKHSALKLAGRIIPYKQGYNTPQPAAGFIPVVVKLYALVNVAYVKPGE